MQPSAKRNVPFLALAIAALLAALWAGLIRVGWQWPVWQPALPTSHGPLMISGFLGTLIGIERAVALTVLIKTPGGRAFIYAGPALSGVGGILLLVGVPGIVGPLLLTLGSLGLVAVFGLIIRKHPALFIWVMGGGALAWLLGNVLWLAGRSIYEVVLWWMGFLVLTIAGERLELGQLIRLSEGKQRLFLVMSGIFSAGLVLSVWNYDAGMRLAGAGMVALAGWLLAFDVARRTVRKDKLPRFSAICLLTGYVWLALGGLLAVAYGGVSSGLQYDAILHMIFLGFTFSMIFGHAPIIFPAVLGAPVTYHPSFYAPLVMLHASLILRMMGNLLPSGPLRLWGALLNAVTILLFFGNTIRSILQGKK